MRSGYLPGLAAATLAVTATVWVSVHAQSSAAPPTAVDFARDIQPILQKNCYECHGPKKTKAKLRLDSPAGITKGGESGAILVAGKSEHSLIVRRILGLDGDDRMPKDGDPLPTAQLALIRAWIDQGAHWPQGAGQPTVAAPATDEQPVHWAYRRPVRSDPPEVKKTDWVRTPIDRFILARLEKESLIPSAEAPFEVLVRRVWLDLIGLPPSPARMPRMRGWWTHSSPRRITANAGRARGSTSPATPTRRDTKRIFPASCGSTGIGSSTR
jgi:mono/diheme cytochrome c family protein